MSRNSQRETTSGLDPVLTAAMNDLTSLVYDSHLTRFLRPRQLTTHFHLDGPETTGRAGCVAMFKSLKHFGVEWDTAALCDWATQRGWVVKDVDLLREFGSGVQSGARFHTGPAPWARSTMQAWLRGEATRQPRRTLKIMSCCGKKAELAPSRAEKLARNSARFTRP
jgi:hypothetical protein